ncbi:VWA domain-containing protein [Cylindrospermum stagnale]|uniref:VWA domain-containing protein n=1 Tax=Cylindrospermum stagnale TaxID=142864 RepID=UPI0002DAC2D9|nr:VWA domain-containing protein [Cylindrospermum stagnale]
MISLKVARLGKADIYYFHNCPTRYLYRDPTRQKAEAVADFLMQLRPERSAVLIFSDGGAARGGFSGERWESTVKFIDKLKQRVRHIAWLNPMSTERWDGTTAGEIARLVPMFEISRQGLDNAIAILRGGGNITQLK